MTNQPKTLEQALEMFDENFHYRGNGHWFHTVNVCADEDDVDKITGTTDTAWAVPDSFKSFLESVWHAGRESVVEEWIAIAEGMKGTSFDHSTSPKSIDYSYDAAITDVITKLSELKEKK